MAPSVGEKELAVLLAVRRLMTAGLEGAYGVTIQSDLNERGYPISVGALYTMTTRLEQKGFLQSWEGGATATRGGRKKRFFKVTGAGSDAIQSKLVAMDRIRGSGLETGPIPGGAGSPRRSAYPGGCTQSRQRFYASIA